jgi:hypothetical protein
MPYAIVTALWAIPLAGVPIMIAGLILFIPARKRQTSAPLLWGLVVGGLEVGMLALNVDLLVWSTSLGAAFVGLLFGTMPSLVFGGLMTGAWAFVLLVPGPWDLRKVVSRLPKNWVSDWLNDPRWSRLIGIELRVLGALYAVIAVLTLLAAKRL